MAKERRITKVLLSEGEELGTW